MRLYLDSADSSEWLNLMPTGAFYGITTNPLLTARAGLVYDDISWKNLAFIAADVGAKEIHVQVHGDTQQALKFAESFYPITDKDISLIIHSCKTVLTHNNQTWEKVVHSKRKNDVCVFKL